jgi:NADPH-dependent 2,4-dienoyl-CoA reductase/sulfur reductase-like enzyme
MTGHVQLAVIGAGPAGMAASIEAANHGVAAILIDEQPRPGGQIYRAITSAARPGKAVLGDDYEHGTGLTSALAASTAEHWTGTTVWQVTPEREIYLTRDGVSRTITADAIIIANGATERPMPFPGWTLPGVMTAGAGQILLKTSRLVPQRGLVLAGSGPLLLLIAAQYLRAGGAVEAIVETTPRGNTRKALRHLPGALKASGYLLKGLGLLAELGRHKVRHLRNASHLEAIGDGALEALRFLQSGKRHEIACSTLMLHIGVVPNVQISRSLDLPHDWDELQRCWRPRHDQTGATELDGVYVAGDGAGIGGALAAEIEGRIAGLAVAGKLGTLERKDAAARIAGERSRLARDMAVRPFLDALYAPSPEFLAPGDDTIVCRCEEVTAGQIRSYVSLGCIGPNQTKSFGRSGMGPCQGRMCGLTVSEIIARETGKPMADVGYYRIRPPIKPVTLGELAALHEDTHRACRAE